jgi:hypothetical protein
MFEPREVPLMGSEMAKSYWARDLNLDLDELHSKIRKLKTAMVTAIKKFPDMPKADKDEFCDLFELLADYLDNIIGQGDLFDTKRRALRMLALYRIPHTF